VDGDASVAELGTVSVPLSEAVPTILELAEVDQDRLSERDEERWWRAVRALNELRARCLDVN
jgi:hypothetical protein